MGQLDIFIVRSSQFVNTFFVGLGTFFVRLDEGTGRATKVYTNVTYGLYPTGFT
jgi:hypothetical protein